MERVGLDMGERPDNIFAIEEVNISGISKTKRSQIVFYPHMKKNNGHEIEWGKCKYLDREKNWRRRKINEATFINAINPTESMVHQEILNLEKGNDFDTICSGFNQDFGSIIEKKIQFTKV